MNSKIISIEINSESGRMMVRWPNGTVEFHTIDTVSQIFQLTWWFLKLVWRQKKDGYVVNYSLDGEQA